MGAPAADDAVALDAGADRVGHARALHRARAAALAGGAPHRILRSSITDSWRRSSVAGVDADEHLAPIALSHDAVGVRRDEHPLAPAMPLIRDVLGGATVEGRHLLVVSDREGCILWLDGFTRTRRAAEAFNLVPGALWSEAGAGTNAVGASLAVDRPMQVFAAEHFVMRMTCWTCSAAPVHDPDTGAILGAICLSSGIRAAHPYTLSLVRAAARLAEGHLREVRVRTEQRLRERYLQRLGQGSRPPSALVDGDGRVLAAVPHGWLAGLVDLPPGTGRATLPGGAEAVCEPLADGGMLVWLLSTDRRRSTPGRPSLRALGIDRARLALPGRELLLSARHSEVAVTLALHPDGMSCEELAEALYGDPERQVSARVLISRLRRLLGPWLLTRPYRLSVAPTSDFGALEEAIREGRRGPVEPGEGPLPGSTAPAVVALRARLERPA